MRSNFFFLVIDTIASLSRSRSVGSVDVAGVGTSILQSASMNHQQSSLSLNDMEQLEEAHLQGKNMFFPSVPFFLQKSSHLIFGIGLSIVFPFSY